MENPDVATGLLDEAEILRRVRRKRGELVCANSRYCAALEAWEKSFPGQVKVWFYEQLCENPEELLIEVCEFLEIAPVTTFNHNKIRERVYEGPVYPIGDSALRYLSNILREEIIALHARFDNAYTKNWLEKGLCRPLKPDILTHYPTILIDYLVCQLQASPRDDHACRTEKREGPNDMVLL